MSTDLTSGNIFVGGSDNNATSVTMSNDATMDSSIEPAFSIKVWKALFLMKKAQLLLNCS